MLTPHFIVLIFSVGLMAVGAGVAYGQVAPQILWGAFEEQGAASQ